MLAKIRFFFWSLLPDRCEMPGCSRVGLRGNENVIDGKRVCDYCHAEMVPNTSRGYTDVD